MYKSVTARDIREGQEFLYSSAIQVVVKAELNMLGEMDVWFKPVEFKNIACPANGHLVLDPDKSALLCRD
jgi:hypothetical protein